MCLGYCDSTLTLTPRKIDYAEFSTNKQQAPRRASRKNTNAEWTTLTDADAIRRFERLPNVLGDPGDVDQVVWTLIVTTAKGSKEVRFDEDTKPSSLSTYLDALWKIDSEMTKKAGR
jgi:hypothetical protein